MIFPNNKSNNANSSEMSINFINFKINLKKCLKNLEEREKIKKKDGKDRFNFKESTEEEYNPIKTEILNWFFNLSIEERLKTATIENNFAVDILHQMNNYNVLDKTVCFAFSKNEFHDENSVLKNSEKDNLMNPSIIFNTYNLIENSFDNLSEKIYLENSMLNYFSYKSINEDNFDSNNILKCKLVDSLIIFSVHSKLDCFSLTPKLLENKEEFMRYFNNISEEKSFTEIIDIIYNPKNKNFNFSLPKWIINEYHPMAAFIVALIEQVIIIKFILNYGKKNNSNNNMIFSFINENKINEFFNKRKDLIFFLQENYSIKKNIDNLYFNQENVNLIDLVDKKSTEDLIKSLNIPELLNKINSDGKITEIELKKYRPSEKGYMNFMYNRKQADYINNLKNFSMYIIGKDGNETEKNVFRQYDKKNIINFLDCLIFYNLDFIWRKDYFLCADIYEKIFNLNCEKNANDLINELQNDNNLKDINKKSKSINNINLNNKNKQKNKKQKNLNNSTVITENKKDLINFYKPYSSNLTFFKPGELSDPLLLQKSEISNYYKDFIMKKSNENKVGNKENINKNSSKKSESCELSLLIKDILDKIIKKSFDFIQEKEIKKRDFGEEVNNCKYKINDRIEKDFLNQEFNIRELKKNLKENKNKLKNKIIKNYYANSDDILLAEKNFNFSGSLTLERGKINEIKLNLIKNKLNQENLNNNLFNCKNKDDYFKNETNIVTSKEDTEIFSELDNVIKNITTKSENKSSTDDIKYNQIEELPETEDSKIDNNEEINNPTELFKNKKHKKIKEQKFFQISSKKLFVKKDMNINNTDKNKILENNNNNKFSNLDYLTDQTKSSFKIENHLNSFNNNTKNPTDNLNDFTKLKENINIINEKKNLINNQNYYLKKNNGDNFLNKQNIENNNNFLTNANIFNNTKKIYKNNNFFNRNIIPETKLYSNSNNNSPNIKNNSKFNNQEINSNNLSNINSNNQNFGCQFLNHNNFTIESNKIKREYEKIPRKGSHNIEHNSNNNFFDSLGNNINNNININIPYNNIINNKIYFNHISDPMILGGINFNQYSNFPHTFIGPNLINLNNQANFLPNFNSNNYNININNHLQYNQDKDFMNKLRVDVEEYLKEVNDIVEILKPLKWNIIENMEKLLKQFMEFEITLDVFGSFASDLSIESSDVDLKVNILNQDSVLIDYNKIIFNLVKFFKEKGVFEQVIAIQTASIPIIKLVKFLLNNNL